MKLKKTIMILFCISAVFVIATLPLWLAVVTDMELHEYDARRAVFTCLVMLRNMHYACNFFLYCLTGTKFRNELLAIFGKMPPQHLPVGFRTEQRRGDSSDPSNPTSPSDPSG